MMLHIDASEHRWFGDERCDELICVLDDETSEIYYAELVEAESTTTVMAALREVIEAQGLFCTLSSPRSVSLLPPTAEQKLLNDRSSNILESPSVIRSHPHHGAHALFIKCDCATRHY